MGGRLLRSAVSLGFGICVLLVGCGKKSETTDEGRPEVVRPPQTEIDSYLDKQYVSCQGNQACPTFLAKIVVVLGKNYKQCTGFLTEENIVATSASCLPTLLRRSGQDCSRDVFFFFPKAGNRPMERVGCRKVILVSNNEGSDPILWRDDVAFLELSAALPERRRAFINRDGVPAGQRFTTWMIDQQDDFSALIKKGTCESVHNNYINPLAWTAASPNMLFADCPVLRGGTGAPVLDGRGRVRSMISKNIDPKLRAFLESTGLLREPLKDMVHATNFACAPTPRDSTVLDERECAKDLTYARVDRFRAEMLSSNLLFGELRKNLEDSLLDASRFVRFGVKLNPKADGQVAEIFPLCFKPFAEWLAAMSPNRNIFVDDVVLPSRTFKRSMDGYARITGTTVAAPDQVSFVQFSLKNIRTFRRSSVLMWTRDDADVVRTFPGLSEECPASLL
jgi:hypothetical protein